MRKFAKECAMGKQCGKTLTIFFFIGIVWENADTSNDIKMMTHERSYQ